MAENLPDTNVGNIEYIRREDAVHTIMGQPPDAHYPSWYAAQIEAITAADVAPAVHSRWIKTADGAECEKCGREAVYQIIDDHWQYEPFCPHCGAKMDGGKNT